MADRESALHDPGRRDRTGTSDVRPLVAKVGRVQRLVVFEAAARSGGFTAAARELGMTQPAVTRQVRALEQSLNIELFTEAGRTLLRHVDRGFAEIERALAELAPRSDVFVLACHPGLAQLWLVPRLEALQAALGQRELRLWLFHRDDELEGGTYDAAVRVGSGRFPGVYSTRLFDESVFPVATPAVARQHGLGASSAASAVSTAPLLHMDDGDGAWLSWSKWFAHFGVSPDPTESLRDSIGGSGPRILFNNYPMVLQQAVAGRGVALGWRYLVDDLVDSGVLEQVGPSVESGGGYYITWPEGHPSDAVRALTEWLVD
jgi:LysR family transcriptional regulator, glycine cleavage system transcriptional activator